MQQQKEIFSLTNIIDSSMI